MLRVHFSVNLPLRVKIVGRAPVYDAVAVNEASTQERKSARLDRRAAIQRTGRNVAGSARKRWQAQ